MLTVTFALFLNAQLTFSPVKYPYCVPHRLLLSIGIPCWLYDVEEIYINVLVPLILTSCQLPSDQSASLETVVP